MGCFSSRVEPSTEERLSAPAVERDAPTLADTATPTQPAAAFPSAPDLGVSEKKLELWHERGGGDLEPVLASGAVALLNAVAPASAAVAPATEAAAEAAAPSAMEAVPATEAASSAPAALTPAEEAAPPDTKPITNGWDAQANKPIIVGYAPPAPRPDWLPKSGPGQKNVGPLCWSLSVEQWIFFVRACVATDTWKKLAEVKGGYEITMYDVNDHFVKPWTQGTGCSIALLMNTAEQLPVEGMLSHAWAGSVVETYNCLLNMVNHSGVPKTARFFFCTFSMYQPQDGAAGGLSISEQIELEPFAKIIESKPTHGMFVLHTTVSEVYDRLWVAHEADEGINAKLQMRGLFDVYRWTVEKFESAAAVKTSEGRCGVEKDRAYIEGLIQRRGGYERLDGVIAKFRREMNKALILLLESKPVFKNIEPPPNAWADSSVRKTEHHYLDWITRGMQGELQNYASDGYPQGPPVEVSWSDTDWKFACQWSADIYGALYPLGDASYPLGVPGGGCMSSWARDVFDEDDSRAAIEGWRFNMQRGLVYPGVKVIGWREGNKSAPIRQPSSFCRL